MSSIEERIVRMVFDNSSFEHKIASTIKSLNQLDKTTEEVGKNSGGMSGLRDAFSQTEITSTRAGFHIQDVWLKMASIFEYQIAGKIVDAGKKIAKALTIDGVTDGFKEYELKMGSVQTIMAGTGESLAKVNGYLEELNKYSDQTIYSFADMTSNIGKFTNAGISLGDSVAAIKGVANAAALAGANSNEASRAMYNFSQALSAGYVKLIDWKSIENANMATKGFKDTLLEVASTCGTVEKGADGMYTVLSTNAQGATMKDTISATKNFNDSLAYQWMTTDVLTKTLKIYSTNVKDLTDAEREAYEAELKEMGLTEEQIKNFEDIGMKAGAAATEVKTFSMLIDTLKEAIGSGWAQTWEIFIGDFEEAKVLWTEVSNVLGGMIDQMSDSRNALLKGGLDNGWEKFTQISGRAIPDAEKYRDVLLDVAKASGKLTDEQFESIDSTEKLIASMNESGWVTGDILTESVEQYYRSLLFMNKEERESIGITDEHMKTLRQLSLDLQTGAINAEDYAKKMGELGGRQNIIEGLRNSFQALVRVLKPIGEAFREVFPAFTSEQLYKLTVAFKEFTAKLMITDEVFTKLKSVAKGFFSIFDIGIKFIKAFLPVLAPLGEHLKTIASLFLDVGEKVGNFFTELDEKITKNKTFENFFGNIQGALSNIANKINFDGIKKKIKDSFANLHEDTELGDKIEGFGDKLKNMFSGFSKAEDDGNKFKEYLNKFTEYVKSMMDKLKDMFKNFKLGGEGKSPFESFGKFIDDFKAKLSGLKPSGDAAAGTLGKIKDKFVEALKSIGETIKKLLSNDDGSLTRLINAINSFMLNKSLADTIKSFSNIGESFKSFGEMFGSVTKIADAFKNLSTHAAQTLDAVTKSLAAMQRKTNAEALKELAIAVGILAASIFVLATIDSGKMLAATGAITTMMFGITTAMAILMKAVNSFSSTKVEKTFSLFGKNIVGLNAGKILEISTILSSVAKALLAMGGSILMMAIAMKMIASVAEDGHLWDSFAVLSLILGELTAVSLILSKFSGSAQGTKGLLSMSASLIVISLALAEIAKIAEGGHLWDSFSVLTLLMGELTAISLVLSNFSGDKKGVGSLLVMTSSLLIVAMAVKQIAGVIEDGNGLAALGIISALLIELTAVSLIMSKFGKDKAVVDTMGMLMVVSAVSQVVNAMKKISREMEREGSHMIAAFVMVEILLASLAAVSVVMSKFGSGKALLGGAGAVAAALALVLIAKALAEVNEAISGENHVWQALAVIGASLVVLAVGVTAMVGALPGAIALTVAAVGLIALGGALKIIGSMSLAEVGKGLLALAGSIAILAVGLTAMALALPGAVALTVAAVGLIALGTALKIFGSMSLGDICSALLGLVVAITGLGVAAAVLGILSPLILAFSVAVIALGAGLMTTGVGLTLFATGIQAVVGVLPMVVMVAQQFAELFTSLAPMIVTSLMECLGLIIDKLLEYSPKISAIVINLMITLATALMEGLGVILNKLVEFMPRLKTLVIGVLDIVLSAIEEAAPRILNLIFKLLVDLLDMINSKMPEIARVGANLMISFMNAITNQIPRIVDAAYKCAIALINGLADAIRNNNKTLIEAVNNLMDAVIQAITEWLVEFTPLGVLIPENMKSGIEDSSFNVLDAAKGMVDDAVKAIKDKVSDFKGAAESLIDGFLEGLKSTKAGEAFSAAANFGNNMVKAMNSKKGLNVNSPSKKGIKSGKSLLEGVIIGIQSLEGEADAVAAGAGGKLANALDSAMELVTDLADNSMDMNPVITPVLDLTTFKKDAGSINGMLDLSRPLALAGNVSMGFNANVSPMSGLEAILSKNSNTDVVNAIRDLNNNLADAMGTMSRLQVVMDTGTLVGSIAAPMDSALGRMQTMKERGI